ncbi:DUF1153 domain-containing protein [Paracoccus sp. PAMC 22219]|uniref:CtrA inhibitor SciP n=1 Tax=Paracoccus sp. PAMC 22219 TaxID=1569209 RepID=UPI0005AB1494|nr:DUF1153 domain-containing protein [Paracoccus sp. PAMC 22219]
MFVRKSSRPRTVKIDDGNILSVADLPDADTRWVASRKQTVVLAVSHGLISREDALKRYRLSDDEFSSWCRASAAHGKVALTVTALQKHRQPRNDTAADISSE